MTKIIGNVFKIKAIFYKFIIHIINGPEVFCKKGVLKNFTKFTGKHLCQSFFLIQVTGEASNFIKIETLTQVFYCEFCKIFKNIFFMEHLLWLLLNVFLEEIPAYKGEESHHKMHHEGRQF